MTSAATPSETSPPQAAPGLIRALGPGTAIAIVVGNVIGAGIFLKPSRIAADCGYFPLIISGWILAGIVCMFGALCFAELASMLPHAGGLYVFLREAYGKSVAFLFGLNEYVFGRTATNGALAVAFAGLGLFALMGPDYVVNPWLRAAIACSAISLLAAINIAGVVWGGHVQSSTTLVKAGFLGVIALLPFLLFLIDGDTIKWSNYTSTVTEPKLTTITAQFAAIFMAVMWAYNGWHDIAPVAEEVRDPQRNIPLSLILGTGIIIVLYVSANLAYHGALTMSQMAIKGDSPENTADLMIRTVLEPYGTGLAKFGGSCVLGVTLCSIFGALNCNLMLGPRVAFAMARDGVFWRPLAHVHPTFRTPAVSILTQAIVSCAFVLVVTFLVVTIEKMPANDAAELAKTDASAAVSIDGKAKQAETDVKPKASIFELIVARLKGKNAFDVLTDFVVYSANIFYALCVLAVYVLRVRHPEWHRPYRTWGYPIVPGLYLIAMGWFLVAAFSASPFESAIAVGLMLSGLPLYWLISFKNRVLQPR